MLLVFSVQKSFRENHDIGILDTFKNRGTIPLNPTNIPVANNQRT
jgi:hypothetical protein